MTAIRLWGSSPRMRGTLRTPVVRSVGNGIIPAHAGNTNRGGSQHQPSQDHPRACGEHRCGCQWVEESWGSSPRMRGTRLTILLKTKSARIIPAHAGNTRRSVTHRRPHVDHPRACGEHSTSRRAAMSSAGSSPRMRGTPEALGVAHQPFGIIPAHAGNTELDTVQLIEIWDHPRACGEHKPPSSMLANLPGSSPRMRGTLAAAAVILLSRGIIPAHAGNTSRGIGVWACTVCCPWDHPRACGEHVTQWCICNHMRGSSPRMRGTRGGSAISTGLIGIIPAHAGNTAYAMTRATFP